ncbi:MAG: ligand-binding sensor domain-containing protein, partial [Flavobacteriales bacterium]
IWFGNRYLQGNSFLYKYDVATKEIKSFTFPGGASKYQYRFISDAFFDSQGILWMATMNGVFRFDESDESWTHFINIKNDLSSLSSNQTLAICPDPNDKEHTLWIGTEGAGLNKLNIATGKVERFNTQHGLPNNVVYSIQSDHRNNLWFGTNKGLCQFNPIDFSCKTFTKADGLPSDEFNRYEYSKDPSGNLYFGGMGGLVKINPEDFYQTKNASTTAISYLMLFNEPVAVGDANILDKYNFKLGKPIETCEDLVFNHTHDMITFGFAHLNLTAPKSNRFKFKLEGLNQQWIDARNRHEATFTDLQPGDYSLLVKGASSDGNWNEQPTVLNFTVLGPWYSSWWAVSLALVFFIGILYAIYHVRITNLLKFERMRNGIAQDLHDEIGSTLSSISLYSAALVKSQKNLPKPTYDILEKIDKSATEILGNMNDIVWTIKSENDNFSEVLNRIRSFASNVAETKGIKLEMTVADFSLWLIISGLLYHWSMDMRSRRTQSEC